MLLPGLTLMLSLSTVTVRGLSTCPAPEEVASRLTRLLRHGGGAPLEVELTERLDELRMSLWGPDGQLLATRAMWRGTACAELAESAAWVIAAWAIDFADPPAPAPVPATPLRAPLKVGRIDRAPVPDGRVEVGASTGITASRLGVAFLGVAELAIGRMRGPGLLVATAVDGPSEVTNAGRSLVAPAWKLKLGVGPAWREQIAGADVDVFVLLPVSVVLPGSVSRIVSPLGGNSLPVAALLSVESGARLTVPFERFALYLRAALDLAIVNSSGLELPPVVLTLAVGMVWSAT